MNHINLSGEATVEVSQEDRDAAAPFAPLAKDDSPLVQAFARHRLSTSPDRRVRDALEDIVSEFEGDFVLDGEIVDDPPQQFIDWYRKAKAALATTVRGSGDEK